MISTDCCNSTKISKIFLVKIVNLRMK